MRCNVGIHPLLLTDQHLIAEYRELFIVLGQLKKQNYKTNSIPENFSLGLGHINFFKNKLFYLKKRHSEIIKEMDYRGFTHNLRFDLPGIPKLENDWAPTLNDSVIVRNRIKERLLQKENWYRYRHSKINDIEMFIDCLNDPYVFYV